MREKDAANTRKLMERQLSKEEQDELNRRSQAMDKNDTSDLRLKKLDQPRCLGGTSCNFI